MKIGIIGTRGIPNKYGGFEQFTEHIAPMLVKKGHEVTVYNSSLHPIQLKEWKGVNIITKKDPEKNLGTAGQFIYDLLCIIDCRKRNYDIILQLGYTSSSIWSFLLPSSSTIITNMDGLEWKRSKYSSIVKSFLKYAEAKAVGSSDVLIADSPGIQEHLQKKYRKNSTYIPYGALSFQAVSEDVLQRFHLKKYMYNLVIARLEPENNIEMIIEGNLQSQTDKPLLIFGSTATKFGRHIKEKYQSAAIRFCEAVYDLDLLNHLRYYSHLYFHGHSVGGTNPSLLEAMASEGLIATHDNIFNRYVCGSDAFYFANTDDIANIIKNTQYKKDYLHFLSNNSIKIRNEYSWTSIVDQLETCFTHALY
ncbi:MAG: DUF1972 domain-containing protein [Chitinophagaceae bacterium]